MVETRGILEPLRTTLIRILLTWSSASARTSFSVIVLLPQQASSRFVFLARTAGLLPTNGSSIFTYLSIRCGRHLQSKPTSIVFRPASQTFAGSDDALSTTLSGRRAELRPPSSKVVVRTGDVAVESFQRARVSVPMIRQFRIIDLNGALKPVRMLYHRCTAAEQLLYEVRCWASAAGFLEKRMVV